MLRSILLASSMASGFNPTPRALCRAGAAEARWPTGAVLKVCVLRPWALGWLTPVFCGLSVAKTSMTAKTPGSGMAVLVTRPLRCAQTPSQSGGPAGQAGWAMDKTGCQGRGLASGRCHHIPCMRCGQTHLTLARSAVLFRRSATLERPAVPPAPPAVLDLTGHEVPLFWRHIGAAPELRDVTELVAVFVRSRVGAVIPLSAE